ncbi:EmrB/QacA subfamily drug resistance transporter [Sphaerotilus hippei]|uniref:EmrB/QacA subfamily drug resistance transporter n=1 Tax=Sphaerotilus hippei TaxID=744406 RepID=A0A318H2T9_9BURK|nr:MFS transporter [Sphaerotilus hippei]PXW95189.1 EmrB/QacA subfamily drug resistance transporter [Sphaerotilus hippei]
MDTTAPSPAPGDDRHRQVVLALVLTSYLMIVLDISIVITGLPRIRDSLGFSPAMLSWVHTAYTLAFGGALMAGARAGDLFGRRRMLILGLALFVASSLAIGLAVSSTLLVVARAVQGLGSAILAPATLALLSVSFAEGPERTRALGWYGATAGVGASIGMVLGGVLADLLSWRAGFFINVPIGLALLWTAWRFVPQDRPRAGRLDLPGAALSTSGMVLLVHGLVAAAETGWHSAPSIVSIGLGSLLLAAFFVHESRTAQPLLPLRLFDDRVRSGAYAARLLFLAGVIGFWFYLTQYLQGVLGMRPMQAGLAFLPATLVQLVAAMGVSPLARRWGHERVLATGVALATVGMAWLARIGPDTAYLGGVALPMVVLGIGQGLALSPLTIAGVSGVAPNDAGAASGLVNASHQLGGSLGLALLVVVHAASARPGASASAELAHRVATCLAVSAGLLGLCLLVVLACIVPRRPAASS